MGLLLFIIAYILMLPLTLINWILVKEKSGYFRSTAINIDKFANRELRTLWNKTLIKQNGYRFGDIEETISAVLGHNIINGTLTRTGKILVWVLTEKHCINSIH